LTIAPPNILTFRRSSTGLSSLDGNYLAPRHNISPYLSSSRSTTKLTSLPDWLNPIGFQFSKKKIVTKSDICVGLRNLIVMVKVGSGWSNPHGK